MLFHYMIVHPSRSFMSKRVGVLGPPDLLPLGDHHLARPEEVPMSSDVVLLFEPFIPLLEPDFRFLSLTARTASTVCQE